MYMRLGLFLIVVTGIVLYDVYYDHFLIDSVKKNQKYIKMGAIAFAAFTIYIFFKKMPKEGNSMLIHANDIIKYMPIDKKTSDLLTPIFDFTFRKETGHMSPDQMTHDQVSPQMKRMLYSGKGMGGGGGAHGGRVKRSVSETKKKYVASNQQWMCGHCQQQLDHTFEVDHIQDLQYGGDNSVGNLVALCPNCHRKKTTQSKL